MDYFQGVVTEYLRAKRSQFVNTEYMINLDEDGSYRKNRHWFCDAVAIDFEFSTVYLCEITYSKTLGSIANRLQAWASNWSDVVVAIHRDSALKGSWTVVPRVFVPEKLQPILDQKRRSLIRPAPPALQMPEPIVTLLESVLPWKYRSWNGKPFGAEGDA